MRGFGSVPGGTRECTSDPSHQQQALEGWLIKLSRREPNDVYDHDN